jgi:hypothetical protein
MEVNLQAMRKANAALRHEQKSLQDRPVQFLDRVQEERIKERTAMMKYVQPELIDPEFAERFLDEDLHVIKLDCEDSAIDDKSLIKISNQKRLVDLSLSGTKVTDKGMIYLPLLVNLSGLNLDETFVTDNGLKFVAQLPSLNYLTLRDCKVTDRGLSYLKGRNLYSLILDGTLVTDNCIPTIAGMRNMQNLTFNRCSNISNVAAKAISQLQRMEFLGLEGTHVNDAGCLWLAKLPALKQLEFGKNSVTAAGIRSLSKLPSLERLNVHSCHLNNDSLPYFSKFAKLNHLNLNWNGFDDSGLAAFAASQPKIEWVEMRGCWAITDAGSPSLYAIKKLKKLDLRDTKVSAECLNALRKARPDIKLVSQDEE